jgi:hypothetical protein
MTRTTCKPDMGAGHVDRPPQSSLLAIGNPGRAATELPAGAPITAGVPDIAVTAASTDRIEIRAASVRGLQHRAALEPRQDTFSLRSSAARDELIAVVCDGVGSLPRSHEAAAFAARRLAELSCAGSDWPAAFAVVSGELDGMARPDDPAGGTHLTMATTALALRVSCDGEGWHGRMAWVGDSPLWHLAVDGNWSRRTGSDLNEEAHGFHCSSSPSLPAATLQLPEAELDLDDGALFLMSDGVGNPLAWVDEVRTTLARWWAAPPDMYDFARQVGFARQSHVDDRTVVGLWLRN